MSINAQQVIDKVKKLADLIIENEVYFCELDSVAGDGDFGMSISKGFREILNQWDELLSDDVGVFIKNCSLVITEYCGGASGPIWGSAFRGASKVVMGKQEISNEDIAQMFQAGVEAIQKRGGAVLGDKTLLDALIPATQAMLLACVENKSAEDMFKKATVAAVEGAKETESMVAKKGRATYVGERSLNYPDAGAMAIGVLFTKLC